ncbi:MAG: LTA synthase family protein, partial [Gemmatimonadetes bacterium]|nr:LTA synthase family protein [Gemmatimonadota bacterium]
MTTLRRCFQLRIARTLFPPHLAVWLVAIAFGVFQTYGWVLTSVELVMSAASLIALVHAVQQWAGKSRRSLLAANTALTYLIGLLWLYGWGLGGQPDYAILAENATLIFDSGTFELIRSELGGWPGIFAIALVGSPFALQRRFAYLTAGARVPTWRGRFVSTGTYGALLSIGILTPLRSFEGSSSMIISAYYYHMDDVRHDVRAALEADHTEYPYRAYHDALPVSEKLPHVFVVLMESYNGLQIDRRVPDGREITPFFNRIVREGLSVELFYSNSIQTARGFLSVLCSTWPSIKGKAFVDFESTNYRCLPEVLREHGYATRFYHNSNNLEKEGIGHFLRANAFDEAYDLDSSFVADHEREELLWGYGDAMQDDVYLERVLRKLDAVYGKQTTRPPTFTVISTGSHHRSYRWMPEDQRFLFKNPQDKWQWFATSLNTFDTYLERFFDMLAERPWIEDPIVVLVGDHGMPAGEHGGYHNEKGFYEENFRTPLVIWSPGRVPARTVTGRAYSHIDIMPTLLDQLGISTWSHMLGTSILRAGSVEPKAVIQIQPYNGRSIGVVSYPYKYVHHQASQREFLFDLAADP